MATMTVLDSVGSTQTVEKPTAWTRGAGAADATTLRMTIDEDQVGITATTSLAGVTLVADGALTQGHAGLDGVLIVRSHCNLEDIVSGNQPNTDGTSTSVITAAGSGVKIYLTRVILTNMSATGIYVEMKSGSTTKATIPLPATSGATVSFDPPLPPNAANEAWNFDPSAAATTVYCTAVGFKSKV